MSQFLLKSEIKNENDIVTARKRTRELAQYFKLDSLEQTRLATAVSEIVRNAFEYARKGVIEYNLEIKNDLAYLVIVVKDNGPGIKDLSLIMSGNYISPEGMGIGIHGSRNLVDDFKVDSSPAGTTVTLKKFIPLRRVLLNPAELKSLMDIFITKTEFSPALEIQKQNQEILLTVAALNEKKEELVRLNKELEDTNRGVVALYAELDEKAESLRIANETKTSFLSDMTHEFRSPLNSIMSISQILLEEARDEKNSEREKQVGFVMAAARGLSDLVNDLLDIAKIEAGKIPVRADSFLLHDLFSTLRGLMRPLGFANDKVTLNIMNPSQDIFLRTDEGKVAQMLRNLISNAIKYTDEGEINVMANLVENDFVEFCVSDTGIGIPEEHLESIFSEFTQVETHHQKRSKGTGLGLPLTRKLAHLLGGTVRVESMVGKGSIFYIRIPIKYQGPEDANYLSPPPTVVKVPVKEIKRVLIIDDDPGKRYQIQKMVAKHELDTREARDGIEGLEAAFDWNPEVIILDLVMPGKDGIDFLKEAMIHDALRKIPVILFTSKVLEAEEHQYLEQVTYRVVINDPHGIKHLENALVSLIEAQRK